MSEFLNHIVGMNKELEPLSEEYVMLYERMFAEESDVKNEICLLLSTIHKLILDNYEEMNERLPATEDSYKHFRAEPSRQLIKALNLLFYLQEYTNETQFSFDINEKYECLFRETLSFLKKAGGSEIPIGTEKVELPWRIPIVIAKSVITIKRDTSVHPNKKQIGNGSYANVYSYKDDYYNETFIVKTANKNLNAKELERFRNEFKIMNNLNSPYIVKVFTFDNEKNEYIMEHMDDTLYNYIQKNNDKLTRETRFSLVKQLLKAFKYIHKKNYLHRDISFTNILIKIYDDNTLVLKVADFGLAKDHSKNITAKSTEVKGSLNDPVLNTIGWENYRLIHEIYPLTWIVAFILTGRENLSRIDDKTLRDFIGMGMCPNSDERFQDVDEMYDAIKELEKKLK